MSQWKTSTISEIATVVRGSSPRPAKDPKFFDGTYLPWITVGDILQSTGPYLLRTASMLTQEGAKQTRILEQDTFLLTNSGAKTLGIPKITRIKAGANDGVAALLNLSPSIVPEFLYFQLLNKTEFLRQRIAAGNDQLNLNTNLIRSIQILIPPLPEQRQIAAILSSWDRAIELTEKLIAAKQKRKQALMQQLLTGKVRFADFDGEPWKEVKLGQVFKERRETGNVNLPLLSITSGEGIVYRDSLVRKDSSNADKTKYLRICPGDIGYNTMRMWQGVSALSDHEGIVSPAYTICTPNPDVDARFMSYLFKYPPVVHVFWRYSQGMVSDTLNLKYSSFSTIKLRIPKQKDEQRKIGEVLLAADKELRGLVRQVEQLSQQKKGLMQQLLTGKVRVNTDQETVKG